MSPVHAENPVRSLPLPGTPVFSPEVFKRHLGLNPIDIRLEMGGVLARVIKHLVHATSSRQDEPAAPGYAERPEVS